MIPKIDVAAHIARKAYEGSLQFSYEAEEDLIEIPFVHFASPIGADLHYVLSEDGAADVWGVLTFALEGNCSRCLEETRQEIGYEVQARFVRAEPKDDEYSYRGTMIDLKEFLRDSVSFALPLRLLCDSCAQEEE